MKSLCLVSLAVLCCRIRGTTPAPTSSRKAWCRSEPTCGSTPARIREQDGTRLRWTTTASATAPMAGVLPDRSAPRLSHRCPWRQEARCVRRSLQPDRSRQLQQSSGTGLGAPGGRSPVDRLSDADDVAARRDTQDRADRRAARVLKRRLWAPAAAAATQPSSTARSILDFMVSVTVTAAGRGARPACSVADGRADCTR